MPRWFKWLTLTCGTVAVISVAGLLTASAVRVWLDLTAELSMRDRGDTEPSPTVIADPELARRAITELTKKPTIVERVTTKEVVPSSVSISTTPIDSSTVDSLKYDTMVEKEDRRLSVSSLNRNTGHVTRSTFQLPSNESDFTLRAGPTEASLRTDRNFGIRIAGDLRVQLPLVSSNQALAVRATYRGPIQVGTSDANLAPYAYGDTWGNYEAGISAELRH